MKAAELVLFALAMSAGPALAAPFDLDNWNLNLPIADKAGKSLTVHTAALQTHNSPYFRASDDRLVFWSPVQGATTRGSEYPRSELRNTYPNGELRNWGYRSGTHRLSAKLAVEQIPSSGRIAIGQIHVKNKSTPLLIIYYNKGRIEARFRPVLGRKPMEPIQLLEKVPLGQRFTYSATVDDKGVMSVTAAYKAANGSYSAPIDKSWRKQQLYFKAGAYVQDNKGSREEGGRVSFYYLKAVHR